MKAIAKCVHASPGLRKSIASFAELYEDETGAAIARASMQQTDPSILPVYLVGGQALNDSYSDNPKIRLLMEDLAIMRDPKRLEERRNTVRGALDERVEARVAVAAAALGTAKKRRTLNG
jgi:hypothetical protein